MAQITDSTQEHKDSVAKAKLEVLDFTQRVNMPGFHQAIDPYVPMFVKRVVSSARVRVQGAFTAYQAWRDERNAVEADRVMRVWDSSHAGTTEGPNVTEAVGQVS